MSKEQQNRIVLVLDQAAFDFISKAYSLAAGYTREQHGQFPSLHEYCFSHILEGSKAVLDYHQRQTAAAKENADETQNVIDTSDNSESGEESSGDSNSGAPADSES